MEQHPDLPTVEPWQLAVGDQVMATIKESLPSVAAQR